METTLVNIRWHPFRAGDPDHAYIGRAMPRLGLSASPFANPFRLPKGQDTPALRRALLEEYRAYLLGREDLVRRLPELRGKVLHCWCVAESVSEFDLEAGTAPRVCHGEVVIAELLRLYGRTPPGT